MEKLKAEFHEMEQSLNGMKLYGEKYSGDFLSVYVHGTVLN